MKLTKAMASLMLHDLTETKAVISKNISKLRFSEQRCDSCGMVHVDNFSKKKARDALNSALNSVDKAIELVELALEQDLMEVQS